jgi:dihydrofolate synthase/folylpolyglutamate synthase
LNSGSAAYDAALGFLHGRIDYERMLHAPYGQRDFRLDRMRELAERLGSPDQRMQIVHVAGTKGKGSTAAMTAAILAATGYRSGLYSSPHLERLEERIAVDGRQVSPEQLAHLVERIRPAVAEMDRHAEAGRPGPTYFEILTAMALVHFAEQGVEWAVLEVGLGGRLDSTNICRPAVAVITSISYDHTRQLGSTLTAIAGEKAGIIKPSVPVVSGVVEDEPRRVIDEVAARHGCSLARLGRDFSIEYRPARGLEREAACGQFDFEYRGPRAAHAYRAVELSLLGAHQAANAAVALATIAELNAQGAKVPEAAMRRGLAAVSWPARVEVVSRRPTVVLDAAHNVASVEAFAAALDESFAAAERILVFATTRDKDAAGMLRVLLPRFDRAVLTRYANNPRGLPAEELAELAAGCSDRQFQVAPDPAAAWEVARSWATAESLIGITGSFFIAAEMRPHAEHRPWVELARAGS